MTLDRRVINALLPMGGLRIWEVTLLFSPGWVKHPQLDDLTADDVREEAVKCWMGQLGWDAA